MKLRLEVSQIPDEGLLLDGKGPSALFEIEEKGFSVLQDIRLQCKVIKTQGGVFMDGVVSTVLELNCCRCLDPFPLKVQSNLKTNFLPKQPEKPEYHEVELSQEDLDTIFFEGNEIDLCEPVRDMILLAIPINFVCNPDCKGLCPNCGKNLEKQKCNCKVEEDIDPRLAVLKNFFNRKE